jgi:hypothetical protein
VETAGRAGGVIGFLLIVNMLGSGVVNFDKERPLFGGAFLLNAAPSSQRIGLAVVFGLITEAMWIAIAFIWQSHTHACSADNRKLKKHSNSENRPV